MPVDPEPMRSLKLGSIWSWTVLVPGEREVQGTPCVNLRCRQHGQLHSRVSTGPNLGSTVLSRVKLVLAGSERERAELKNSATVQRFSM